MLPSTNDSHKHELMKVLKLLGLIILAFGFTTPVPVKLTYTFKVGDAYVWNQDAKQLIKQSIMGMDQTIENNSVSEMSFKIVEIKGDVAKLETMYTKFKSVIKSPQMNTEFDSDGPQDKRENKLFKALTNKPFFVFMTRQGKIDKVEGIDTLFSAFKEAGLDENGVSAFRTTLEPYIGEEGLRGSLQKVFISYPANQLKKGDTWKESQKLKAPFPTTMEDTWSLGESTDKSTELTGQGTFFTDKEQTISLPGGMKARIDLAGNQAMKSSINPKTGWPLSSDVLSEVKGKMILLAGGPIPEDMEMPMEINSEIKSIITKK